MNVRVERRALGNMLSVATETSYASGVPLLTRGGATRVRGVRVGEGGGGG